MFGEYRCVLKPYRRLLVLETTRPASVFGMALARLYFGRFVSIIARLATGSADYVRHQLDTEGLAPHGSL